MLTTLFDSAVNDWFVNYINVPVFGFLVVVMPLVVLWAIISTFRLAVSVVDLFRYLVNR